MRTQPIQMTTADLWYWRVGNLLSRVMVHLPDEGKRGTHHDVMSATFLDAAWNIRNVEQEEKNEERLAAYKKKCAVYEKRAQI